MTVLELICGVADLTFAVFAIALLLYSLVRFNRREMADYFFSLLCLMDIGMLLANGARYLVSGFGRTYYPEVMRVALFFMTACLGFTSPVFTNYMACYLKLDDGRKKVIRVVSWVMSGIFELLAILNVFFGFLCYIDTADNTFHRGPLWWLLLCLAMLILPYDVYLFIKFGKKLHRGGAFATWAYILLFISGSIIYAFVKEVPVFYWFFNAAVFITFFNIKSEQNLLLERQKKELVESKTSIMLSQIQPHFLHNSLTAIAALCDKDAAEAKRATLNFSRYLRKNLDSVHKKMSVPFSEELEHVQTYLELEMMRFGDRLFVSYDIQSRDFMIPPLTIQPLAENAVKHGICNKESGEGALYISSCERPDYYEVVIKDDGVGFDINERFSDGREHVGIENVRTRLKTMCDAVMTIESAPMQGTVVTIRIPKSGGKYEK